MSKYDNIGWWDKNMDKFVIAGATIGLAASIGIMPDGIMPLL